MWEETLVFTLHMPQIALVRFLVWDHDPIGRDFIGQRTIAFTSMLPGYRHVHLEGMEEASIFVHVAVNDITGKVKPTCGIKGLFHRNQNQGSLDGNTLVQLKRKPTFREKFLHRTATVPTKARPNDRRKGHKLSIEENSSESDSEQVRDQHSITGDLNVGTMPGRLVQSEPLKRANRVQIQDPANKRQGLFNRLSSRSPRRASVTSSCKWAVGSKGSPSLGLGSQMSQPHRPAPTQWERVASESRCVQPEPPPETNNHPPSEDWPRPKLLPSPRARRSLEARCNNYASDPRHRKTRPCSIPRRKLPSPVSPVPDSRSSLKRPDGTGIGRRLVKAASDSQSLSDSDSSSGDSSDSLDSIEFLPWRWPDERRPAVGTLQREMSALFDQKMDEIRSKSPILFTAPLGNLEQNCGDDQQ
ncbi:hypothetical protein SKAU_G00173250 [Synaphobranchus kaupii]|uniref:C2 domain-containing protein n=1 Tax=Synaphobranchus kaupii TaxID=118154 RepID=A0A9Q1FLE5_SYNKA|nr:hypothetical protein SKAU_G00173250 [Synaphobranchus kaupii]